MGTGEHRSSFGHRRAKLPCALHRSNSSPSRLQDPPFPAARTHVHPLAFSSLKSSCHSNTANNSSPVCRTLSSFFSPGKTKQWKQATTLNGRPYVVGHVPRGLNSREVEFEGLHRGSHSSTKVISLDCDGPVKRDVNHLDAVSSRLLASTVHPPPSLAPGTSRITPRL